MSVEDLYQDLILDHFRHPRCCSEVKNPDASVLVQNPLCGDEIGISLKKKGDVVEQIRFCGKGCSISQAAASMVCELIPGKTVFEIRALGEAFREMLTNSAVKPEPRLGDALALQGVRDFPVRHRCALLVWEAIERCLSGQGAAGAPQ